MTGSIRLLHVEDDLEFADLAATAVVNRQTWLDFTV